MEEKFLFFSVIAFTIISLYRTFNFPQLSRDLYVETKSKRCCLVPKGTPLPLCTRKTFTVVSPLQTSAQLRFTLEDTLIGQLMLQNLIYPEITVVVDIDRYGNAKLTAKQENAVTLITRFGQS